MENRIAEYRKKKGWSQERLALALGVSRQHLSLWETGQYSPRLEVAFEIARLLDCTVDDLFSL